MPMMNAYGMRHHERETFASMPACQVFLIALPGDHLAPLLHRGNPLHPMQVMLTGLGERPPFVGIETAIGPLPQLPAPVRLPHGAPSLAPREIAGEILRDGEGRLYERLGDRVRPINQIYMGARGEMIDLTPMREGQGEPQAAEPDVVDSDVQDEAREAAEQSRPFRELVRRLVPEPGLWRLVRYADFIDAITPQLADPRRLQPSHQLACYVQIYELAVTRRQSSLERAAAAELGSASRLVPLSYDLCRRFALSLPRPAFALAAARHGRELPPGVVAAGARFMTLRVALDPTGEALPAAPITTPVVVQAPPAAPATTARAAVPEDYTKPWEMRLTRDEVLYDMTLAASRGWLRRMLDAWRSRVKESDRSKWRALLSGKAPDEQLWSIKPPQGGLGDDGVRRWAEQTLKLAGYEMPRMLVEWEIHWRRKGL